MNYENYYKILVEELDYTLFNIDRYRSFILQNGTMNFSLAQQAGINSMFPEEIEQIYKKLQQKNTIANGEVLGLLIDDTYTTDTVSLMLVALRENKELAIRTLQQYNTREEIEQLKDILGGLQSQNKQSDSLSDSFLTIKPPTN